MSAGSVKQRRPAQLRMPVDCARPSPNNSARRAVPMSALQWSTSLDCTAAITTYSACRSANRGQLAQQSRLLLGPHLPGPTRNCQPLHVPAAAARRRPPPACSSQQRRTPQALAAYACFLSPCSSASANAWRYRCCCASTLGYGSCAAAAGGWRRRPRRSSSPEPWLSFAFPGFPGLFKGALRNTRPLQSAESAALSAPMPLDGATQLHSPRLCFLDAPVHHCAQRRC